VLEKVVTSFQDVWQDAKKSAQPDMKLEVVWRLAEGKGDNAKSN